MSDNADSTPLDRRDFAKRMVGGAVVAPLTASALVSNAEATEPSEKDPVAAVKLPLTDDELYLALINRLDAENLRPEHLEKIRRDIAGQIARSKRLSGFPLSNSDEPAPVFAAWRAEN